MHMTTYTITAGESTETRSSKPKAIELATALRNSEGVAVSVTTAAGNTVFELDAPRKIRMSKPFTRVVPVPEGVEVPDGFRFAYSRPRRGVAVVHSPEQGYRLLNLKTSKLRKGSFETSRDAGKAVLELPTAKEREAAQA